jgi:hypothetical protein
MERTRGFRVGRASVGKVSSRMVNEVADRCDAACYKTGQLHAKAAYLDTQRIGMPQYTVQGIRVLFSLVLTSPT